MTQTLACRRPSPPSYHFLCLQFLGLLLSQAVCPGVQGRWVVQQLEPHATDNVTRLAVRLSTAFGPSAPASFSSFTLCLWFKVTTFRDLSCLLSYALNNETDDAITIFVRPSGVEISYDTINIHHGMPIRPLWWYPTCVKLESRTVSVWVAGVEQLLNRRAPALALNGSLVLGQEQDDLDGGFISNQAFVGHVTGLTLWSYALISHQLQAWADCGTVDGPEANLTWDNIQWVIHNDTGGIKSHFDGPCHQNEVAEAKLMFFTNKLSWSEARQFLLRVGLNMINSSSTLERQEVTDLLQKYKMECTNAYSEGVRVWLGIYVDETNSISGNESQLDKLGNEKARIWKYAVSQDEKGIFRKENPSEELCFVGRYTGVPEELRLQGFCGAESLRNMSFIINPTRFEDQGNPVYLHGYGDYHIMQTNHSSFWCLIQNVDRGEADKHYLACVTSESPPFGRLSWSLITATYKKASTKIIPLVLSRCPSDYFTCPDSSCIHLSKLCNNVLDCQDGTDEKNCFTCIKPPGYVMAIPPYVPVQLLVTVAVTRIGSTNLLTSVLEVDATLKVSWTDHRLEFRHLNNSSGTDLVAVIVENDSKVWMPDFRVEGGSLALREVENALEVQKKTNGTVVDGAYIAYSGVGNPLVLTMDLNIVSQCHFDLQKYPWDVQECYVHLQVRKLFKSQVVVLQESHVRSCPTRLVEYDISACELSPAARGFDIKLVMARCSDFHIWTTYLPTTLLMGIGYGTLFLPVERFPERGGMSLTTLLVFISLYTDISSSLPNTSYIKLIDVWFVFNIVFLSLIIATHLLACGSTQETGVGPWMMPDEAKVATSNNKREKLILKVTRIAFGLATFIFLIGYFSTTMR